MAGDLENAGLVGEHVTTLQQDKGKTIISDSVVAKIAGLAAREVEGVHALVSTGLNQTVVGLAKSALPVIQAHLTELQKASSDNPSLASAGSGGQAAASAAGALPITLGGLGLLWLGAGGWLLARRRA